MDHSLPILRSSFIAACALAASSSPLANAAEPVRVAFQNGKSVPVSSLALKGDQLVVTVAGDGFTEGQLLPVQSADHVFGDKPAPINQALALLLTNKDRARDAQKILEPVVAEQRITSKIYGNYWLEAARGLLVAYAVNGDTKQCTDLGKEISDATPAQGADPFIALGKALLMPPLAKVEERESALRDQTTDNLPAEVCAYASFFRGDLLAAERNPNGALQAYLSVSCLYPTGGMILNAAAELKAADLLAAQGKRDEALMLVKSAVHSCGGTSLVNEANKRLESLK